jgi:hypothetical protein
MLPSLPNPIPSWPAVKAYQAVEKFLPRSAPTNEQRRLINKQWPNAWFQGMPRLIVSTVMFSYVEFQSDVSLAACLEKHTDYQFGVGVSLA